MTDCTPRQRRLTECEAARSGLTAAWCPALVAGYGPPRRDVPKQRLPRMLALAGAFALLLPLLSRGLGDTQHRTGRRPWYRRSA